MKFNIEKNINEKNRIQKLRREKIEFRKRKKGKRGQAGKAEVDRGLRKQKGNNSFPEP